MAYTFRDLRGWTHWLRGLLLLAAALGVVAFVADAYEGFGTVGNDDASKDRLDMIQGALGGTEFIVLLVTFVIAGIWIYRAAGNVRAFGAQDFEISPGWAVGWYFVPIANLFNPFQAMSEIWRASTNPAEWRALSPPGLLRLWWGTWLISNFLDLQVGKMTLRDDTMTMPQTLLTLASDILDIANDLAFFAVVSGVWTLQSAARARINLPTDGPTALPQA